MNTEIAKKRINEVLRPDTMTTTRSDFLATHVAVNNIELYSKFVPTDSARSVRFQEAKSEEVYLLFNVLINYLNENYRKIMKLIWSGPDEKDAVDEANEEKGSEE